MVSSGEGNTPIKTKRKIFLDKNMIIHRQYLLQKVKANKINYLAYHGIDDII